MNITIPFLGTIITKCKQYIETHDLTVLLTIVASIISIIAIIYCYFHHIIVTYGDSESHLNIAKRVVSGLTPGVAQLGGIWLPLPHLVMTPFVFFDFLWRTGLGGSIVSGISFVISSVFVYKLTLFLTKDKLASIAAFAVLVANPNMLYMQATPMTELLLIAFFILSSYYFILYIFDEKKYTNLILAALYGFGATLSRYDGWFLVAIEAGIIGLLYIFNKKLWKRMQGRIILFATPAFFGIILWLLWGYLILGDPLYFTHSQFSAKSQQQHWYLLHELPAYKHILIALQYYAVTSMSNIGLVLFSVSVVGICLFLRKFSIKHFFVWVILFAPFFFNIISLYIGQSVIFIPDITPVGYQWRLFNVRYGILMLPAFAFFIGYLFAKAKWQGRYVIVFLMLFQLALFGVHYSRSIVLADGTVGLSASQHPQAEQWLAQHYDHGLVLMDDYKRIISVIATGIPMQNIIYVGTKPYWAVSLVHPEKYSRWIIIQRDDDLWDHIYAPKAAQGNLYKYFKKVYTSPEILIFERNNVKLSK